MRQRLEMLITPYQNEKSRFSGEPALEIFESGSLNSVFVFDVACINRDGELGADLWVKFDFNNRFTGFFDRFLKLDGVAIDHDAGCLEFFVEIHACDRTECLATLTGGEGEGRFEFGNFGRKFLSGNQFFSFTARALGFEGFDVAEVRFGRFVGFALWHKVVAGVASADFNDIGFGAEAFDFFFEDDLCVGHDLKVFG